MRVTALSGDMVLKAALVLAAVGALAYVVHKVTGAAGDAAAAAADWAENTVVPALDPTADTNLAYRATNAVGGAIARTAGPEAAGMNADGSWTFGGWFYDLTHKPAFTP